MTGLNDNFKRLLDTTIRAIRLAGDPTAPVRIQVCETTAVEDENELTNEELVYMYEPGVSRITTTILGKGLGKAIVSLSIHKANNPAMELAQKANTEATPTEIPDYLKPYASVFEKKAAERFPEERPYDHTIELKADFVPKDCKVYQLTPEEDRKLTEFLDENLKKGYIRPSKSPMASPFFFVGKKDGNLRPCQDYRYLNEGTVKNAYPLPLIADLVDQIKGYTRFTKMDVRAGYNNVRIKDGDQWKAAFKTNKGLFEPTVMFFRLCNSPATFQAMMNDIFADIIRKGWLHIYMDDMLIGGNSARNIQDKTIRVVQQLQAHDLYLKLEKCLFDQAKLKFLGMIISHNAVSMDPVKVQGITDWPAPTTVKQVRGFLGFGNFYRRFIDHYAEISRPLNDLTKKDAPFDWTDRCQDAFEELKRRFTTAPVMRMPDTTQPFVIESDASLTTTAAVLRQQDVNGDWHPVAYLSQSLLPAKRNYEIYDRELLAIVRALEAWRHYIMGGPHAMCILTDHKNLTYFWSPQKLNRRQARWHLFLSQFNYVLHHCPGSQLVQADALTRTTHPTHTKDDNIDLILLTDNKFAKGTSPLLTRQLFINALDEVESVTLDDTVFDQIRRLNTDDSFAKTV